MFKRNGFTNSLAIDKHKCKGAKASMLTLDLTDEGSQRMVLEWIRHPNTVAVFLAPPCGTCSLARLIPIPDNENAPKPLRTALEPDGISGLQGHDKLRVSQANILYAFVAECVELCTSLHKPCMVENPKNSIFWLTSPWRDLSCHDDLFYRAHQACAYGSKRPKWTLLCANFKEVLLIDGVCDGQHTHEPWGITRQGNKRVFATSLEVHYPEALCQAIFQAYMLCLADVYQFVDDQTVSNVHFQAATGVQPRGSKLKPLFSPYSDIFVTLCDRQRNVLWPPQCPSLQHAKLLHSVQVGGYDGVAEIYSRCMKACNFYNVNACFSEEHCHPDTASIQFYGFLWEPWQFVERAINHPHPFSVESCLPDILQAAIVANVSMEASELANLRLSFIKKWTNRAISLAAEETGLKTQMDPVVAECTKQKRILLFAEILRDLDYQDMGVIDELKSGSDLVGDVPITGMLPGKVSMAIQTPDGLAARSRLVRKRVEHSVCSSGDVEIDKAVWEKTLEEVSEGWLSGPLDPKDVGIDEPISRRFGLKQRDKVRPIDDFSASGVNDTVTSWESPMLHTVDVISSVIVAWFQSAQTFGKETNLLTRTFDLTSAYRQVALSCEGRKFGTICVFDPNERKSKLFRCNVLPFGAVRSVHCFLRLVRALWFIAVKGCCIVWSSFYDDFVTVASRELTTNTEQCIVSLFKLTGWAFAESGRKCQPFALDCEALGVQISLHEAPSKCASITNTQRRIVELLEEFRGLTPNKQLTRVEAQRLRGRMQFAESQLFGRAGRRCIKALSGVADGFSRFLNDREVQFISIFCDMLEFGRPRSLAANTGDCFHIFTDACYERDANEWPCGIGGVLVGAAGPLSFFSLEIRLDIRTVLGEQHKKQIIFECETLAAVVAFVLWSKFFSSKRCMLYVDNEGSKFALIKGFADNDIVDKLAHLFATLETDIYSFLWIARVASFSNVADKPSRGDTSDFSGKGVEDDTIAASGVLDSVVNRSLKC